LAIVVSIAITDPIADPEIAVDGTFTFEVTATMSDSTLGFFDLYFEYDNGTNQANWYSIPASGGGLTCPAPNPVNAVWNQETGNVNSKTVTGKVADTYYIRGRSVDAPPAPEVENFTDVQVVTVTAGGYEFLCTGSGGATTGGIADLAWTGDYIKAGSGGAITSGLAALLFSFILAATGGAATDGTAGYHVGHDYAGVGGGTSGGIATVLYQYDYAKAGVGGATTGGAGTVSWTADYIETGSGGAATSGSASLEWSADYTEAGSGGATTGGAADVVMPEGYEFLCTGAGGAATSGAAGLEFDYVLGTSGGAMTSGAALHVRYLDGGTGVDHQYKSAYRLKNSESADRGGIWHSNKFCNIESTARKRDWQSSYRAKE